MFGARTMPNKYVPNFFVSGLDPDVAAICTNWNYDWVQEAKTAAEDGRPIRSNPTKPFVDAYNEYYHGNGNPQGMFGRFEAIKKAKANVQESERLSVKLDSTGVNPIGLHYQGALSFSEPIMHSILNFPTLSDMVGTQSA